MTGHNGFLGLGFYNHAPIIPVIPVPTFDPSAVSLETADDWNAGGSAVSWGHRFRIAGAATFGGFYWNNHAFGGNSNPVFTWKFSLYRNSDHVRLGGLTFAPTTSQRQILSLITPIDLPAGDYTIAYSDSGNPGNPIQLYFAGIDAPTPMPHAEGGGFTWLNFGCVSTATGDIYPEIDGSPNNLGTQPGTLCPWFVGAPPTFVFSPAAYSNTHGGVDVNSQGVRFVGTAWSVTIPCTVTGVRFMMAAGQGVVHAEHWQGSSLGAADGTYVDSTLDVTTSAAGIYTVNFATPIVITDTTKCYFTMMMGTTGPGGSEYYTDNSPASNPIVETHFTWEGFYAVVTAWKNSPGGSHPLVSGGGGSGFNGARGGVCEPIFG